MTSANRSSEPIAYRDDDARRTLGGIADAMLMGEREIARRVDDSVASGSFPPSASFGTLADMRRKPSPHFRRGARSLSAPI